MRDSFYGPQMELTRRGLLQILLEALPPKPSRAADDARLIETFCATFKLDDAHRTAVEACVETRQAEGRVARAARMEPLAAYAAALEQAFSDRRITSKEKAYLKLFGALLRVDARGHAEAVRRVKEKLDLSGVTIKHPPELSVPEAGPEVPDEPPPRPPAASSTPPVAPPEPQAASPEPQAASPGPEPKPPSPPRRRQTASPRPAPPVAKTAPEPVPKPGSPAARWAGYTWQALLVLLVIGLGVNRWVNRVVDISGELGDPQGAARARAAARQAVQPQQENPYDKSLRIRAQAMRNVSDGRYAQAEGELREAISLNGRRTDQGEMLSELGWILLKLKRYEEAEKECRKATELNPGYAEGFSGLGVARLKLGREADAVTAFKKAVELRPDYTDARALLGTTLMALGRDAEALSELTRVTREEPANASAGMALLELESRMKRRGGSR